MSSVLYHAEIEGFEVEITRHDLESLDVESISSGEFHIIHGVKGYRIKVVSADHANKMYRLIIGDKEVEVNLKDAVEIQVHDMGLDEAVSGQTGSITAPMPGLVLEIDVQPGDSVSAGDSLIILEAMKMENVLSSPGDGVIGNIHVEKGQPVEKSQLLITFEDS